MYRAVRKMFSWSRFWRRWVAMIGWFRRRLAPLPTPPPPRRYRLQNVPPPPRQPNPMYPDPINLNNYPDAIIHRSGFSKYTTVQLYRHHTCQEWKFIIRCLQTRQPDQFITLDSIPDGASSDLILQLAKELDPNTWIPTGYGKLYHDPAENSVTFYEEEDVETDQFDGHSEVCYMARDVIDRGGFRSGYISFHVLKNGQHSPKSAVRRREKDMLNAQRVLNS